METNIKTTAVREKMISFLRQELVGPRPGLPFIQLNGEEVLPPEDPPRSRYGAGVIYPRLKCVEDTFDDIDEESTTSIETENLPDVNVKPPISERKGNSSAQNTISGDNDLEINRANEMHPSGLGVTVLMAVPASVEVEICAAQYERIALDGEGFTTADGTFVQRSHWFRRPLDQTLTVEAHKLDGSVKDIWEEELKVSNTGSHLALHIYSRPAGRQFDPENVGLRFITFSLLNRTESTQTRNDELCFFQCGLSVRTKNSTSFYEYPEKQLNAARTKEESSLELLYRHKKVFAVGHGCAADWDLVDGDTSKTTRIFSSNFPSYDIPPIIPSSLEGTDLSMALLAKDGSTEGINSCESLVDKYKEWIKTQEIILRTEGKVPPHLQDIAKENIENCRSCLTRITEGVAILKNHRLARAAFALMNQAMLMQNEHYIISTDKKRHWQNNNNHLELSSVYQPPNYEDSERNWRPFQLAFILMTLRSIVLSDDEAFTERDIVDLIWFPTGGGKTEAYLGLTAFTIFWRRLNNPENAGTTALMRYTLRLLTTQQFQRAAALICSMEIIRRQEADLGDEEISIGLWVGGSVTPNKEKKAIHYLNELFKDKNENPFIIRSCPWCGAAMGKVKHGRTTKVKGYSKLASPARVRLVCEDSNCDFSSSEGLPLRIIDEHIYNSPPTLLIGTVDKFALLPFLPQARSIFGIDSSKNDPPDLIIQDELHLISGPLGSMVGHYETVIDALTTKSFAGKEIRAKIVASTATISRADEQVSGLYGGRENNLFPPQALEAGNSFFAHEDLKSPGRTYVGVFASSLPSLATTEKVVLASLLQGPPSFDDVTPEALDPYWTSMVYFNSIRELGHAATLLNSDIPEYLQVMWRRFGFWKSWGDEWAAKRRFINEEMELTSRVQNDEITEYMERLFHRYPETDGNKPVDVCLATNMIQVGLDVSRLSLMAIIGQPKSASEYIQASSRVGRSKDGPGLVVTVLNPSKSRDRSHFEKFRAFHQSIYRYVEPTSLTPFALPVCERALHAVIISFVRMLGASENLTTPISPPAELREKITNEITQRVMRVDPQELSRTLKVLNRIFDDWDSLPPDSYGKLYGPPGEDDGQVPMIYPSGTHPDASWEDRSYPTQTSMRNVDANCEAKIVNTFPGTIEEVGE